MKTRRFKRIRWLLLLSLSTPLVSHAANDSFANLCEGTGAQCPKLPKDEQGITDLMTQITQQWLLAAVEQEIQAQTPTEDTGSGSTENPEPDVETTDQGGSQIPNPMPAPPPTQPTSPPVVIIQPPAVEKPVEEPKVSGNSSPQQPSSTGTSIAPTQPTDNKTEDKTPESNIEVSPPATTPDPVQPPVAPTPTEPTQTVTEDTTETTPSTVPISEVDNKDTCPPTPTLQVNCRADYQIFDNITVATGVSISQIQLRGQIVNEGMISNSTLLANSTLTGGKISGEFNNLGTVQNIHFVGKQLHGGTLAGEIVSKGELQNVHLAANAHIQGESTDTLATLSGTIQGDAQHPALLEYVKIAADAQVTGVKFGTGVMLDSKAIIDLPTFEHSWQVNKTGIMFDTTTKFSGGLSLSEPMNFVKELTIEPDQAVKLRFNITPEVGHIGQRAQVLFVVGTEKSDASGSCSAGTTVSYKVLLQLEQRDVDLYAQPNIWIPQLVERHDENQLPETHVVFYDDLWQSKQLTAATCHYFFIGYRLAQDNTIVFDTTPLRLKVK